MKWLGQYVQSLTSRFRSDVYLESISTGTIASGAHLGLDSNNKIVKAVGGSAIGEFGYITIGDGSKTLPSITFGGENDDPGNTGIFRDSENTLGFSGGGVDYLLAGNDFYRNTTGGAYIKGNASAASAPTYTFKGYQGTGMYRPSGVNDIGFSTNGSEKVRILSNGNVGIGTDSPSELLHVSSGVATHAKVLIDAGADADLILDKGAGSRRSHIDYKIAGTTKWYAGTADSDVVGDGDDYFIGTTVGGSNAEFFLKRSNGYVGIGTTSPARPLHVVNTSSQTVAIFDGGNNGAGEIAFTGAGTSGGTYVTIGAVEDDMSLSAGASERMRITSAGNVGIGTTSPQKTLDVAGGDIRLDNSKGIYFSTVDANIGRVSITGDEGNDFIRLKVDNSNSHVINLNTTGVGVGTTSPSEKLDVVGNIKTTGIAKFYNSTSHYGSINADSEGLTLDTVANRHMRFKKAGVEVMRINTSGNVGIGTTSPGAKLDLVNDGSFSSDTDVFVLTLNKIGGTAVTNVKGINLNVGSNDHVAGNDITNLYGAYINNSTNGSSATVIDNWYGVYVPAADADRVSNRVSAYFGDKVQVGDSGSTSAELTVKGFNVGTCTSWILNNSVSGVAVSGSDKIYTITHGMGSSRNYGVQVIRNAANSGNGETVYTDVTRADTTIVVTFASAPTAGDYTALVTKFPE